MRWLLLPLIATSATTRLTRPAAKQAFFVLKRGHSGSTWLSALLLNLPLTYFFDELVGASANFDAKKLEAIFVQALRAPTGRGTSPEWSKSSGDPAVRSCWQHRDKCQLNAILQLLHQSRSIHRRDPSVSSQEDESALVLRRWPGIRQTSNLRTLLGRDPFKKVIQF